MCLLLPAFIFERTVLFLFYEKRYFPHLYTFYCCVICESVFLIALSSKSQCTDAKNCYSTNVRSTSRLVAQDNTSAIMKLSSVVR